MPELLRDLLAVPYWTRAVGLVVGLALVAGGEMLLLGKRAHRVAEYATWLGLAAAGALYGACNDLLTSTLSPAYFELGKQLTRGPDFRLDVVDLGARAGASAGLLLGGVLLLANNPAPDRAALSYRALARVALLPFAMAAGMAPIFAVCSAADLQDLGPALRTALSEADVRAFLLVQRAHVGTYAGAALGTAIAVLRIRRMRGS